MTFKPLEGFIPRESVEEIKPILNHLSNLIDECINFGSNIFMWDSHNDNEKTDESIPSIMLLRHYFDLIDSISILIRSSAPDPSKLILRSVLETHFSLKYLLKEKCTERANAFYVKNILDEIVFIENTVLPLGKESGHIFSSGSNIEWKHILKERQKLLEAQRFKLLHEEFIKNKKGKHFSPWYSCFGGPKNIRELAIHLGEEELYKTIYTLYSNYIHPNNVIHGKLSIEEDRTVSILQLRLPTDAQQVTGLTLYLATVTIKDFISQRIPNQTSQFQEWFNTIADSINQLLIGPQLITTEH